MSKIIVVVIKRESKEIEDIYIREFGRLVCSHGFYLPTEYCAACDTEAQKEITEILK